MASTGIVGTDAVAAVGTELDAIHADIAAYYSAKIAKFGATPPGVDWSCQPTQELRFVQLLKLCDFGSGFSLNDVGCGYGALITYLDRRHPDCAIDYVGIDLSQAMIRRARRLWRRPNLQFCQGHRSLRIADYSVASGIFNVQRDQPRSGWERFIAETLDQMHRTSRRGFAVNFVKTPAGDIPEHNGLYSTEPQRWARYCAEQFGAITEILENYGLREFTLIVRSRSVIP
jgi:SAM-dependent methyltransferase